MSAKLFYYNVNVFKKAGTSYWLSQEDITLSFCSTFAETKAVQLFKHEHLFALGP